MTILLFKLKFYCLRICLQIFFMISLLSLLAINGFNSVACEEAADAYLFMAPPMYIANEIGEVFDLAINISSVQDLRNLEFLVTYNTSLLDVEQVTQGPFFPPSGSYFNFEKNEPLGFIKINMSIADSETPRSDNGTLAWISFKVVQGAVSCISSPLDLKQSLLLNSASIPIVHDSVGAVYFWKSMQSDPPVDSRSLDLCTQKGGEGPDEPGGEFLAGEEVYLISRVMYEGCPVRQKLVSFEVQNPFNESVVIRTAITNENGSAAISFRIPNILSSNGTWRAISVVEIAEKSTWDTISFRVYVMLPVGGYTFPVKGYATAKPLTPYLTLVAILTAVFTIIKRKTRKGLRRLGRSESKLEH